MSYHSYVLTSSGGVKYWDYNRHGQLGDNPATNGKICEFNELENKIFTSNRISFTIGNLAHLFGTLYLVFKQIDELITSL